jgi:hypothetical protein
MKQAAIGISAHSGWGAVVAITGSPQAPEVLERRKIAISDPARAGSSQPYHFAQAQPLPAAERHLADCAAASVRLAVAGLEETLAELRRRNTAIAGCAVLLRSGRSLPTLPAILKSHALIHTAEGEFFRQAFWRASERLKVPVAGFRERDIENEVRNFLGSRAGALIECVANLGKTVGPPWTADQKNASLAAMLLLQASHPFR